MRLFAVRIQKTIVLLNVGHATGDILLIAEVILLLLDLDVGEHGLVEMLIAAVLLVNNFIDFILARLIEFLEGVNATMPFIRQRVPVF